MTGDLIPRSIFDFVKPNTELSCLSPKFHRNSTFLNYAHMRDTGLLQSVYSLDPPMARTWNI